MININFNIRNPWSDRWKCLYTRAGSTPFKNKYWELQVDRCADIVGFDLRYTVRQDHAGLFLSLSLAGYEVIFNVYDNRHWNYDKGDWEVYGDKQ